MHYEQQKRVTSGPACQEDQGTGHGSLLPEGAERGRMKGRGGRGRKGEEERDQMNMQQQQSLS